MQNYASADLISERKIQERLGSIDLTLSPDTLERDQSSFGAPATLAFFAKTISQQEQNFYQKLNCFEEQAREKLTGISIQDPEETEKLLVALEGHCSVDEKDTENLKHLRVSVSELCGIQQQRILCLKNFENFLSNLLNTHAELPIESKLFLVEKDVVPNFEKLANTPPFDVLWTNILERIDSILTRHP